MNHFRRYTAAMLRNAAAAAAAVVVIPAAAVVLACYAAYRLTAGMIRTTAAAVDAPPPGVYFHDDVDMLASELASQSSRLGTVERTLSSIIDAAQVVTPEDDATAPPPLPFPHAT